MVQGDRTLLVRTLSGEVALLLGRMNIFLGGMVLSFETLDNSKCGYFLILIYFSNLLSNH
jgi:hypothetical protein